MHRPSTSLRWTFAGSISFSFRDRRTFWASSNSVSPTGMTSTCMTLRSASYSTSRPARSAMAAARTGSGPVCRDHPREDKGWSSAQVQALLSGPLNNEITLSRQIPVHVTYFTAVADADGKSAVHWRPYGKDARLLPPCRSARQSRHSARTHRTQLSDSRRRRRQDSSRAASISSRVCSGTEVKGPR